MKTAVPGTRGGGAASTRPRNSSSDVEAVAICWARRLRPAFHVVIAVNTQSPIASGTQPPSAILTMLAARKPPSNTRKPSTSGAAFHHAHPQVRVTTT